MTPALRFGGRMVVFVLLYLILTGRAFTEDEKIVKITILGNETVAEDLIKGSIKSRENEPLSIAQLREDLKSIYEMGIFTDVIIDLRDVEGGKEVIFIVVEKPSIRDIRISGNVKIKTPKIREKIDIAIGSILNMEKLKQTAHEIEGLYSSKAYYRAKVEPRVDYLDGNQVDVEFAIVEGKKGYVKKIRFQGNEHFWARKLRKYMKTKKKGWFWLLTKTGVWDEDILNADVRSLQAFYFDHGYIQVKIDKPKITISEDGKWIYIDITIHEGEQFKLGEIDFKGDILTTREDLLKRLSLKRGKVYRTSIVQKDILKLSDFYADKGYAYVEIIPLTSVDSGERLVRLTFDIRKGKEVYFEQITISGNTKTRDKVIRRELKVGEGDLFSSTALKRGRQKLRTTGYFKGVDLTTSKGTTDKKINVDIKVEEAPTGSLSFGAGFSTLEGVVGTAKLSERNLLGLGYSASLSAAFGGESQRLNLGFTDPWFLGTRTTAGLSIYYDEIEYFETYDSEVAGGNIRFGRYLTDYISASLTGKAERVDIFNVSPLAAPEVKEQEGVSDTISITLGLTRDTRDDFYAPTRGSRHHLAMENAGGILGGDNTFYKFFGDTSWYFPLPLNTVLHLRGRAGMIEGYDGKEVPIYEKFYVGGINTIRGYEYGYAGPRNVITGDPLGADKMVVFNSEFIFPLSKELGMRGAVFYDGGAGWNVKFDRWRQAVGLGIRWLSPVGPIRIDWGYNLDPQRDEKQSVWDFTFGAQF
jgi:outer membrane protein insertion porin family